ncbi:hypothetical protein SLEP1_g36663 [Rubroshorea leprosula]|uniref:Protein DETOXIFICATION n=1 Tax=Rubroshorea leprosula TaxID=152421 RepID=A0AAV5KSF4_9ROSI|nr:hypothetical protein SLEP1_g36663 [Rubroshorea leprosula]
MAANNANEVGNPPIRKWKMPPCVFFHDARLVFKMDSLGMEILKIAFPAALALAADPIASLIDTAFIGRLGPVELAAVGVSIAIFNQASKITTFPVLNITTSFVAEEDTIKKLSMEAENEKIKDVAPEDAMADNMEKGIDVSSSANNEKTKELKLPEDASTVDNLGEAIAIPTNANAVKPEKGGKTDESTKKKKKHIPSASTAIIIGLMLGLLQAALLMFAAKPLLGLMGVKHDSPMLVPAQKYLTLRSLGAPAILLSLAMQGVFRGFKDTKTPLYATVAGDMMNVILDPILIFSLHLGVAGAAIAHVLSQYLIALILLCRLVKEVNLLPPRMKDLQFGRFLKNGFMLLTRGIAVTFCVTLAASLAARLGSTPMAAFQICLQVWLTSSLLADGLAVAGQALLACAFAEKDMNKVTVTATRVSQMGFVLGMGLSLVVGVGLYFGSGVFSNDPKVLQIICIGVPFVAATQPINTIAFVFDGINFGASDFAYTAYSMVLVAGVSIGSLFLLFKSNGFVGIWIALTIYITLRMFAGIWRMGTGTGPWHYLRK